MGREHFNKVDNYNEKGSGSIILFIKSIDLNVTKFKKEFIVRSGRGKVNLIKHNSDLRGCGGVHHFASTRSFSASNTRSLSQAVNPFSMMLVRHFCTI
jgi:hypothetical protein